MSGVQPIKDIDHIEASSVPHFARNRIVLRAIAGRAAVHPLMSIQVDAFIQALKDIIANLSVHQRRALQDAVLGTPAPGMRRILTYVDVSDELLNRPHSDDTADLVARNVADDVRARVRDATL